LELELELELEMEMELEQHPWLDSLRCPAWAMSK